MTIETILLWIVVGLVIGAIAKLLMPGTLVRYRKRCACGDLPQHEARLDL